MDISAFPLPDAWIALAWIVALPLLAVALARVPWRALADGPTARLWPAAVAVLTGLWNIRAHVGPHLAFHLSGIAALTLTCGAPLALVGGALVVAASIAISGANSASGAAVWLAGVALPVAVVTAVRRIAAAWLPHNLFVFVFVVAYFGAAIAYIATGVAGTTLAVAVLDTPAATAFGDWLVVLGTLAFGEALLSGMALALGVVYRPHWVAAYVPAREESRA